MLLLLLILCWCHFSCLQMYSEKFFNASMSNCFWNLCDIIWTNEQIIWWNNTSSTYFLCFREITHLQPIFCVCVKCKTFCFFFSSSCDFMATFYGWGSTAWRLDPLRVGSLLFTTTFPEIPGTKGETVF